LATVTIGKGKIGDNLLTVLPPCQLVTESLIMSATEGGKSHALAVRVIAARLSLAVHEISADQLEGRLFIEMHLEVDERLSLREAHRRATELEEEIRKLPGVAAS
jgi:hypothetical protein